MNGETITRRERQRRTRSSLLTAARQLFCQHGLEGASVDEVSQLAGYTKGAFYSNFESKEELFLVMLDEQFTRELGRLERALSGTQEPHEEAQLAAAEFIHFVGDSDWPRLYFQFVAHAARDEDFRLQLATRQRAMRERLAEILGRWKHELGGELPLPLPDLAAILYCVADGFLVDRMIDPSLAEDLYTTMIAVFMRGLEGLAADAEATTVVSAG